LRNILSRPVAQQLSKRQHQFLSQLMRELTRESDRVFQVRRRTEEGLRSFIESGAAAENKAVNRLLSQLEREAVALRSQEVELSTETSLSLPVGPIEVRSPESLRLKSPDDQLDTSNVEERLNRREPSEQVLAYLEVVQVQEVAHQVLHVLKSQGPLSVAGIIEHQPITKGLEELVAHLRIAKAVGATRLEQKEEVIFTDKNGTKLKASIPAYLLSVDLFPNNMNELAF
jgi:phage FluMu protein gp41